MALYNKLLIDRPNWASDTTGETMYADMLAIAQKFCTIDSNLCILEDLAVISSEVYIRIYIGYKDEGIPILCLANSTYSTFYARYGFYFSLVNADSSYTSPAASTRQTTNNDTAYGTFIYCSGQSTPFAVYYNVFNDVLSFDVAYYDTSINYARYFIANLISFNGDVTQPYNCYRTYNTCLYCSGPASPLKTIANYVCTGNNKYIDKYFLMDFGLNGTNYRFKNIYLFSNFNDAPKIPIQFLIGDVAYINIGYMNADYWTPVVRLN